MESQPVTWLIFFAVLIPSISFTISFGRKMWVEILKVVANKSARVFRFITLGMKDLTAFKLEHMDEDSDDEEKDDYELKEAGPKDTNLQGFKNEVENSQAVNLREYIMKARQKNQYPKNEEEEDYKDSSKKSKESDSQVYELEHYDYFMNGVAMVNSESNRSDA